MILRSSDMVFPSLGEPTHHIILECSKCPINTSKGAFLGWNARAGTRTRVQALATPGDNHYTTLACVPPTEPEFKRLSALLLAWAWSKTHQLLGDYEACVNHPSPCSDWIL